MFKFSFFTPKNHGRTQRSKSLDHLTRSGGAKKDGKLARLKRSLSFSERHGIGKHRGKGKENDQNAVYRGLENGSAPLSYDERYIVSDKSLGFGGNRHDRRTYSCFDLRDGNPYIPQFRSSLQLQNGTTVLSTKHSSMLQLSEHAPLSSVENRDLRKEVGIVKPLSTGRRAEHGYDYTRNCISGYPNGDEQSKFVEEKNNSLRAVGEFTNVATDAKSDLFTEAFRGQVISRQGGPDPHNPISSKSSEVHLNHHESELDHLNRCQNSRLNAVSDATKRGNFGQYRDTSTSCFDVSRCLTDTHIPDNVRDQRQKKYIIVKKLYNSSRLTGISEIEQDPASYDAPKAASVSKRLQRARSEGSLLHVSKQNHQPGHTEGTEISARNNQISVMRPSVTKGLPTEKQFREQPVDDPAHRDHDALKPRRSVGRTIETSIDDLLPPFCNPPEEGKRVPAPSQLSLIKHSTRGGKPCVDSRFNEPENNDFVVKLFPDADLGSPDDISEAALDSSELSPKKKKWRKKKRRASAPAMKLQSASVRKSGYAERTLPLLHIAAQEGDTSLMRTLIDIGVDVNENDRDGWPALHHAIQAGQFEAAGLLIEAGGCLSKYTDKIVHEYCTTVRTLLIKRSTKPKACVQEEGVAR